MSPELIDGLRRCSSLQLNGTAYDFDDDRHLEISWYSNFDGILGQGEHTTVDLNRFGVHRVSAVAVDSTGQTSEEQITIDLRDHPPVIEMIEPTNDSILFSGQAYLFQVDVTDPDRIDGAVPCHQVTWGLADEVGFQRLGHGCQLLVEDLRPGVHVLRVDAQDETGERNFKIIRYIVRPGS